MVRQPARQSPQTRRISQSADWVAATGGWRTDLAIADMPKDAAFQLDNFFPESNRVRARYGSNVFASGLGQTVQTVIPYSGAANNLFAAAGSHIFDITSGGVAASVVSGLVGARWSVQQYTNAGGSFLRLVNGLDTPLLYNGSGWTNNFLIGTTTLATQSVQVSAVTYTLSFFGTGSVVLSGVATGTLTGTGVSNRVSLTFTPTAGTLTLTVSGSVTSAQLELGSTATPYVPSTMITGTNLTTSNLSVVVAYRSRLWFIEKNTANLWYLATDAVSGAATVFPCGGSMKYGGILVAAGVWTIPVSTGIQQCLVLMTSEGEILVYQGSDPTTASGFSLLGTFKVGRPLGYDRCMINVGADLAIMTTDGIIPITKAVQLDRGATDLGAITAKIAPTWLQTVFDAGATSDQWQLVAYPRRRMAIVNLPATYGPYQYVMNTETGAWCRFVGLNSTSWGMWEDRLFFGGADGNVYEAEVGSNDAGNVIDALCVGAWNTFGDAISPKYPTLIGATFQVGSSTNFYLGVSADYQPSIPEALFPVTTSKAMIWDVSNWDQAYWAGTSVTTKFAASSIYGISLAPTIRAQISGDSTSISEAGIIGGTILYQKGTSI